MWQLATNYGAARMTRKATEVPEGEAPDDPAGVAAPVVTSARAALAVFVALVVVAFPLLVFHLGTYHWFFRDDFGFIADRSLGSVKDLFTPWDSHWSTVPIIVFRRPLEGGRLPTATSPTRPASSRCT